MIKDRIRLGLGVHEHGARGRRRRCGVLQSGRLQGGALAGTRLRGGLLRAEYVVLCGDGQPAAPLEGKTSQRALIEAYRWLQTAYSEAWAAGDYAGAAGLYIGVRRSAGQPWRRLAPVLQVPELRAGIATNPLPLIVRGPAPVPLRLARLRAAALLAPLLVRAGLDGATAASLLPGHQGFFPSVEVGVARLVDARFSGRRAWLRCLDLPALLSDLVTRATIWTLPDAGDDRWPPGIHLFAAAVQPSLRGRLAEQARTAAAAERARPQSARAPSGALARSGALAPSGPSIPHDAPS